MNENFFVSDNHVFVFKKQQTDEDIDGGISVSSDISSDLEIGSHKDDKPEQTIGFATCPSEQKQNGGQEQSMQPAEEESELDISGER
jgi:hypothetical protein